MELVHVYVKLELSFRATSHFIDKSVARWQTLSVRKSTSGWPHPLLMSSSIIPIGSCQVSCHPCLASTILVHCLTHPLVPLVTDGGRWDSQARSEVWSGLSLPWPCALPLLFSSPSSPSHPPIHLSPALRAVQYIPPTARHVLLQHLCCCTWTVLQKVVPRV